MVQSNLDYPNPRLAKLQAKQKVQVKVQILGTTSICTCTVECSVAIVCYARANDRSAKIVFKEVVSELLFSAKMG